MYKLKILHPNTVTRLRLQPVMHGLAGILFLFNAIGTYNSPKPNWAVVIYFIVVGLASLVFPFIMRRFQHFSGANSVMRLVQVFVCFTGFLYFLTHMQPLIAVLHLIIGLGLVYIGWAEYRIFQPVYVGLDNMGVQLPTTFSQRNIGWNQLNNVILRNDLLTIDFKNNKILQLDILDNISDVKMGEINAFCKHRLGN
ncbi:hypothetical protein F0L74_11145 [Chitinophaga agrisoli]|uniref:Uncharacterized protein n=1 Tax=Chitinophaga agrisoli TaxID=2607653 RepID=A0A5B2VY32_9BACT|nr:hypothetical protein [Chitinophaga agrisoli]KAA2243066.1 hypothetical protein F0L74_11145 [Chitinophaga agrisoli]